MKKINSLKIEKYIKKSSHVRVFYFQEEINCQILNQSDELILLRDIKDWHYDAYMIIPKKHIRKVKYSKVDKCREKILTPLKKEDYFDAIYKLDLKNIKTALESLFSLKKGICIEDAKNNEYTFVLGEIKKLSKTKVRIKNVNLCGYYEKYPVKIKYKNITSIFYDDEYSKKLIEFAKRKNE